MAGIQATNGDDPASASETQQYNHSRSLDIEQMSKILQSFYEDFNSETNYLLIGMYVPVIVTAMAANILVIIVIFKYHYMRR